MPSSHRDAQTPERGAVGTGPLTQRVLLTRDAESSSRDLRSLKAMAGIPIGLRTPHLEAESAYT